MNAPRGSLAEHARAAWFPLAPSAAAAVTLALSLFGIIPLRVSDLVEILVVAYILYKLYGLMRGTIAVQILVGLGVLFAVQVASSWAEMRVLSSLFGTIGEVFVLAVIILFQPEIRRLLLLIGQTNPFVRRYVGGSSIKEAVLEDVMEAVDSMSAQRIGALLVFERSAGLREWVEPATKLGASISKDLLLSLFYDKNPLHDGAVVIRGSEVVAARAILPVSSNMKLDPNLGLRHRAGLGITEQTDALVVIVSEETGRVSIAEYGVLEHGISLDALRERLEGRAGPTPPPAAEPVAGLVAEEQVA